MSFLKLSIFITCIFISIRRNLIFNECHILLVSIKWCTWKINCNYFIIHSTINNSIINYISTNYPIINQISLKFIANLTINPTNQICLKFIIYFIIKVWSYLGKLWFNLRRSPWNMFWFIIKFLFFFIIVGWIYIIPLSII